MAIPEGKERITITIYKETKKLINALLALHSEKFTYSNIVEIALLFYSKMCMEKIDKLEAEEKEKN